MSLCLASAGAVKTLAVAAFTLVWTHSIEKVDWQEDWRITPDGLELVQARVKGSGAGMEPPSDARLVDGWFQWAPKRAPMPEVVLGNSGAAGEWRLCHDGSCQTLSEILGHAVGANATVMSACPQLAAVSEPAHDPQVDPAPCVAAITAGDDDRIIAACGALIDNDKTQRADRLKALLARGGAYHRKDQIDRAIADYSISLRFDPTLADVFNARGELFRRKGDRVRALADFGAAIKLDPQHVAARSNYKSLARELEQIGADMGIKNKAKPPLK